ncbi:MAG TPA: hypothetical protein EYP68_00295 [Candidatus Korarchaeota archaeon]|nr:hypothetical protein [Candidatus Korarchaeota archaeon]
MANKLQANEISSIIKERIENFEIDVDINEVGKVVDKNCPFCEGNESMTPPEIFAIRVSL